MKKSFFILTVITCLSLSFFINQQIKKDKYQDHVINDLQEQLTTLLINEKASNENNDWFQEVKEEEKLDKYGASVLQIGGEGSKFTQLQAYLLSEQGYLFPQEEWILVSFNTPGDLMSVNCREGYRLSECIYNEDKISPSEIDDFWGCRVPVKHQINNSVHITCIAN
jgi:hypothetical protein